MEQSMVFPSARYQHDSARGSYALESPAPDSGSGPSSLRLGLQRNGLRDSYPIIAGSSEELLFVNYLSSASFVLQASSAIEIFKQSIRQVTGFLRETGRSALGMAESGFAGIPIKHRLNCD
jgi:hypothetical protein